MQNTCEPDALIEGCIINLKHNGMKSKFLILGPLDILTENCYWQWVSDEEPLCYSYTLSKFKPEKPIYSTNCSNDYICDNHTNRVYIKKLTNI